MYSSLLIRPPHKHDKTAIASLCGQDLFLIKGVKRWHCIKNITVSSLIVQTQVFFHDCIMKRWVLITIRINMFSFLGLFFPPTFYKRRKDTQVLPWTYERVKFLSKNERVSCIFYWQGLNGKLHVRLTWISYILKGTACAFHDKVHGTHKRKSVFNKITESTLLILTLTVLCLFSLFISCTIKSFYIKLKIHNSDSHSKIFFINYTNIRVLIKKSMDFDDKVPTILR